MFFKEAETHMVWNVQIVIGQPDTVPAHLVDQVFSDNDDLLGAVLDPERKTKQLELEQLSTLKCQGTSQKHSQRHTNQPWSFSIKDCYLHGLVVNTENGTLSLKSSVMWSAKGGLRKTYVATFVQITEQNSHHSIKKLMFLNVYRGRMVPGPGSSGPGTNTKRQLQDNCKQNSSQTYWNLKVEQCRSVLCYLHELPYAHAQKKQDLLNSATMGHYREPKNRAE